jgi:hypothetical protein
MQRTELLTVLTAILASETRNPFDEATLNSAVQTAFTIEQKVREEIGKRA